jgi:hypothetical protein
MFSIFYSVIQAMQCKIFNNWRLYSCNTLLAHKQHLGFKPNIPLAIFISIHSYIFGLACLPL